MNHCIKQKINLPQHKHCVCQNSKMQSHFPWYQVKFPEDFYQFRKIKIFPKHFENSLTMPWPWKFHFSQIFFGELWTLISFSLAFLRVMNLAVPWGWVPKQKNLGVVHCNFHSIVTQFSTRADPGFEVRGGANVLENFKNRGWGWGVGGYYSFYTG